MLNVVLVEGEAHEAEIFIRTRRAARVGVRAGTARERRGKRLELRRAKRRHAVEVDWRRVVDPVQLGVAAALMSGVVEEALRAVHDEGVVVAEGPRIFLLRARIATVERHYLREDVERKRVTDENIG